MDGTIQGFHGTCQGAATNIKKEGFLFNKSDEHWLGNGIYFYLDVSLAKRWAEGLSAKFGRTDTDDHTPVIIYATISNPQRSELVDTRDKQDYDFLKKTYKEFLDEWNERLHGRSSIKREFSMGKFRCMFFDWLHRNYPIEIVIAGIYIPKSKSTYNYYTLEDLGLPFIEYQMCVFEKSLISLDNVEVI